MDFKESLIMELKVLKENATAYQISKDLEVSKSTIYRLFKDFEVGDFQFDTIAKLVDYGRILAKERAENDLGGKALFKYRNERIWLLNQIVAQPIVWLDEVECTFIKKPTEVMNYLVQPNIEPREIEYSLYPYMPTLNNATFVKGKEYMAELHTDFNLVDNAVDVRITISEFVPSTEGIKKVEIVADKIFTAQFKHTNIEGYAKELTYLASLFRRYAASILTEKGNNLMGYSYYVAQEHELTQPQYGIKKVDGAKRVPMSYIESLHESTDAVFYELEELLKGMPYTVSAHFAYEQLNNITHEFTEFIPTVELIKVGQQLQMFFKHYNAYGFPVTTQLLAKAPYNEQNLQRFTGMVEDFVTQAPTYYKDIEEQEETYMFQAVQVKLYI